MSIHQLASCAPTNHFLNSQGDWNSITSPISRVTVPSPGTSVYFSWALSQVPGCVCALLPQNTRQRKQTTALPSERQTDRHSWGRNSCTDISLIFIPPYTRDLPPARNLPPSLESHPHLTKTTQSRGRGLKTAQGVGWWKTKIISNSNVYECVLFQFHILSNQYIS